MSSSSDTRCPAVTGGHRCDLQAGHNSPHVTEGDFGKLTWEPLYVSDLRRLIEDAQRDPWRIHLEDVLQDIGEGVSSEAIEDARGAVADARRREERAGV